MSTESSRELAPGNPGDAPLVIDGISYIPSSVLLTGIQKLSFKDNRAFGVLNTRGESPRSYANASELGIYCKCTRSSVWEMTFNGVAPVTLSHDLRFSGNTLVISMSNRDLTSLDGNVIPRDTFLIRRVLTLVEDIFHELVIIRNFDSQPHPLRIEQWVGSRFDDIFEVRGFPREKRGQVLQPHDARYELEVATSGVDSSSHHVTTLSYLGLDHQTRTLRIDRGFEATPIRVTPSLVGHSTLVNVAAKGEVLLRTIVTFDAKTRNLERKTSFWPSHCRRSARSRCREGTTIEAHGAVSPSRATTRSSIAR